MDVFEFRVSSHFSSFEKFPLGYQRAILEGLSAYIRKNAGNIAALFSPRRFLQDPQGHAKEILDGCSGIEHQTVLSQLRNIRAELQRMLLTTDKAMISGKPIFDWMHQKITAAVREVGQSGFADCTALLNAADQAPLSAEAKIRWRNTVEKAQQRIADLSRAGISDLQHSTRCMSIILEELNSAFFAPLRLEAAFESGDNSKSLSICFGNIYAQWGIDVEGERVTTSKLFPLEKPPPPRTRAHANLFSKHIVHWQDLIESDLLMQEALAQGHPKAEEWLRNNGGDDQLIAAQRAYAQWNVGRHPSFPQRERLLFASHRCGGGATRHRRSAHTAFTRAERVGSPA